jgi:hypothetical protein
MITMSHKIFTALLLEIMIMEKAVQRLKDPPQAAARVTEEALAEALGMGSTFGVLTASFQLVVISCLQNDLVKAKSYRYKLWGLAQDTGVQLWAGIALIAFVLVAIFGGESQWGVRALAAFESSFGRFGFKMPEGDPSTMVIRQALEKARAQLGDVTFQAAWAEGQQMTMEQALALAAETVNSQLPT